MEKSIVVVLVVLCSLGLVVGTGRKHGGTHTHKPKQELPHAARENRLIKRLMARYGSHGNHVPPSTDGSAVEVRFGLTLQNLISVEKASRGSVFVDLYTWRNYQWTDYRLSWNASEHGGIRSIRLPPSSIWIPDLLLYNSIAGEPVKDTLCVVSSDGSVLWVPPVEQKIQCPRHGLNVTCSLKFGSWTYDGSKINPSLTGSGMDTSSFSENGDYEIVGNSATRNVVKYDCCPEEYVDLTFKLMMKRIPDDE